MGEMFLVFINLSVCLLSQLRLVDIIVAVPQQYKKKVAVNNLWINLSCRRSVNIFIGGPAGGDGAHGGCDPQWGNYSW